MLRFFDHTCVLLITFLLRTALVVEDLRDRVPRRARRMRSALRRLWRQWLRRVPSGEPYRPRAWNRTPEAVEAAVVKLDIEQPHLGEGQLQFLAARVLGFHAGRETFRRILARRRDLIPPYSPSDERRS